MTIFQESSSLIAQAHRAPSNAGPTTNKRSIESNVVVDDGQILVLGGLIEDRYTDDKSKVPLLGDIPYLGALFRSESRTKTRTNLMVFLRPVVMRDADTANQLSLDRYELDPRVPAGRCSRTPSILVPINESPVMPPLRALEDTGSRSRRRRARPARRRRAARRRATPRAVDAPAIVPRRRRAAPSPALGVRRRR